jgi:hypothetical protein
MTKPGAIVLGIVAGIAAEAAALVLSFHGTNLFHGGHPNLVANVLLPGLGIADHLSSRATQSATVPLMIVSLVQFPIYGALLARDYALRRVSRLTLAVAALHLLAIAIAFYGVKLDRDWEAESGQYGACIRANAAGYETALNSRRIMQLVAWRDQSKRRLAELQRQKAEGARFDPDPEEHVVREVAQWQAELDRRWESYKSAGGLAGSPEQVTELKSPCGKPPQRPGFP